MFLYSIFSHTWRETRGSRGVGDYPPRSPWGGPPYHLPPPAGPGSGGECSGGGADPTEGEGPEIQPGGGATSAQQVGYILLLKMLQKRWNKRYFSSCAIYIVK